MASTFTVFGLTAYPYGLMVGVAALFYLLVCGLTRYHAKLPAGTARVYGVLAFPIGLIASRLIYCLFSLGEFRDGDGLLHPEWMLRFWDGGFSLIGLMAGLLVAMYLVSRLQKASFGSVADAMTAPMGLMVCILRLSEAIVRTPDGEQLIGYGKYMEEGALTRAFPFLFQTETLGNTTQYLPAVYRLEAAVGLVLFMIMMLCFFLPKKHKARPGDLALMFFAVFGASQVMLEYLRNDYHMWLNFAVRGSQILSAVMPLVATIVLGRRLGRIRGKRLIPALIIAGSVVCMLVLALMEFSIDGRITLGVPDQTRDYIIMAIDCVVMFLIPLLTLSLLRRRGYAQDAIGVRIK